MSTYSINTGTSTEAIKQSSIVYTLNELADNTSHLLTPHNIRDAIYTNWENTIFKPTTVSGIEYIGIDQNTFQEKILFGKKQISGQNVLNSNLLTSDIDIFIYNTKSDSNLSQQDTKMAFLSGTVSTMISGNLSVPYIQSRVVSGASGSYMDFDIVNTSYSQGNPSGTGNINLQSLYGYVTINGIYFPSLAETAASASNGYELRYNNGKMVWTNPSLINASTIINSGTVSITGNPVMINGQDVAFTNLTPSYTTVGAILAGSTFSEVSVTDMLRLMLYQSLPPNVSLNSTPSVVEVNNTTSYLSYNISIRGATANQHILYQSPLLIGDGGTYYTGVLNQSTLNGYVTINTSGKTSLNAGVIGWTMSLNDSNGATGSAHINIPIVYPYFYGTSNISTLTKSIIQQILPGLTKQLKYPTPSDLCVSLVGGPGGTASIYFCIPPSATNGLPTQLSSIISTLHGTVSSSFTYSQMELTSPNSYWTATYSVYTSIIGLTPSYATIGSSPQWTDQFTFHS